MIQKRLFDEIGVENEDDLSQKLESFEQAVVWGTDWTTETIMNQLIKGNIDLQPKFQRRDAWSVIAKSRFIESLLLGLPIPQIILAEKKESKGKYIVIDGKQRLLTIRGFFAKQENDSFKQLKLTGLTILKDLNGKTYSDLLCYPNFNQLINQLQNQPIRTTVIKNWPNESFLFTVFLRLNTGSIKLSPQELRQALHPGNFIDFADDFSINSNAIKQMLGLDSPDYRMRDVEIVIRHFTNIYFLEEFDGNLKNAFDETVFKLNRDWITEENRIKTDAIQFEESIKATIEIFGEKEAFSKWNGISFQGNFNRAIFDIMCYYFSNQQIRNASFGKNQQIVAEFKKLCEVDYDFISSFEHTTKSIQNTAKRFNTWGEKLAEILGIKILVPTLVNNRLKIIESKNG
ncbi:hypothetical protein CYCD_11690 [Tenuifilaceae bacterium CYCD]|nr:hypothetical protein CYCD_11690 [Tenuifilaceae bacterium CYCD]